ncbi:Two component Transcriptional regulator, Winged helix family [sediment metagenome]|uniref:Two component Transcriptional regulator, Winged helix family n=1 Tax=sediment metagenome TaxID=749907 RepID=D9PHQ6_9ZZZZ
MLGYKVEIAEDGEIGIELFTRAGNFDLVITDIRMPKKDGNDVAKHIRSLERAETPIIAITAYKDEVQTDLFNFSIIKPFRNGDLIKAIRSLEHDYPAECVRVPEKIQQVKILTLSVLEKS